MHKTIYSQEPRSLRHEELWCDLAVIGGGLAGVCASIVAAREGMKVVLLQDRPVLGGNASSEVRLWALGATSHQGNNNRFAREGGVIDEIMVENLQRNPEGNPALFDMVLIDKVLAEKNITLLLNTTVYTLAKSDTKTIKSVGAFNGQNSTLYTVFSPLFCDASGDGIVGYMAGAPFRVGAEDGCEFEEKFSPSDDYGQMLGHSIFFYTKDTGRPVKYNAPDLALNDIKQIPRYQNINAGDYGCRFWWFEYGARLDTVHDTETIKYELWKVVFGVWDYIKNSGKFPEAENMTLEWVGLIPGKRESRRFEGLYMLNQKDIISQARFDDAVAFGGWAIDLHPADGVYSPLSGCVQFHSKGIYSIPYRCMVSSYIENLFLAGRIISVTHVAYGSTRVMMTAAHCAQAVGMAAAICHGRGILPHDIVREENMSLLQGCLALLGQGIPFVPTPAKGDLAREARITASSTLTLSELPFDGGWRELEFSVAQILPLAAGCRYRFCFEIKADAPAELEISLKRPSKEENFTPDVTVQTQMVSVAAGVQWIEVPFTEELPRDGYAFICFEKRPGVFVRESRQSFTGIVSVYQKYNKAVAKSAMQCAPENSGIDSFAFWVPERRPQGVNIAMGISPALDCFGADNLANGYVRPLVMPNAWVAEPGQSHARVTFAWDAPRKIEKVTLFFDTDYDHAMECVQMGHHDRVIPFCVRNYTLLDESGRMLYRKEGNYQTMNTVCFDTPVTASSIILEVEAPSPEVPAALFAVIIT